MSPEQYRYLIAELVKTVTEGGGKMKRYDAYLETADRLDTSVADFRGIAIAAHADRALVYTLRSDTLELPGS